MGRAHACRYDVCARHHRAAQKNSIYLGVGARHPAAGCDIPGKHFFLRRSSASRLSFHTRVHIARQLERAHDLCGEHDNSRALYLFADARVYCGHHGGKSAEHRNRNRAHPRDDRRYFDLRRKRCDSTRHGADSACTVQKA